MIITLTELIQTEQQFAESFLKLSQRERDRNKKKYKNNYRYHAQIAKYLLRYKRIKDGDSK